MLRRHNLGKAALSTQGWPWKRWQLAAICWLQFSHLESKSLHRRGSEGCQFVRIILIGLPLRSLWQMGMRSKSVLRRDLVSQLLQWSHSDTGRQEGRTSGRKLGQLPTNCQRLVTATRYLWAQDDVRLSKNYSTGVTDEDYLWSAFILKLDAFWNHKSTVSVFGNSDRVPSKLMKDHNLSEVLCDFKVINCSFCFCLFTCTFTYLLE